MTCVSDLLSADIPYLPLLEDFPALVLQVKPSTPFSSV